MAISAGIPGVGGFVATLAGGMMVLVVLATAVAVVPFLPDSNAYFRRLDLFKQTVDRVYSGQLSPEIARSQALQPISVPQSPLSPPRSINTFFAIFTFVCILNLMQFSLLPTLLTSVSEAKIAQLGIEVSYASVAPTLILGLIAFGVWIFAAVRTRAGSQAARVFLTIMFTGTALINLTNLLAPDNLVFLNGLSSLIDVPGWYRAVSLLTALIILICSALMLYFLYRPDSNKYFAGMHYLRNSTPQDGRDLEPAVALRAHQQQIAGGAWQAGQPPGHMPGNLPGSPPAQQPDTSGWDDQGWDNARGWQ